MASYIKTDTHISVVFDNGEPAIIYSTNPNYPRVCEAIKNNDWETVYDFAFPAEQVKKISEEVTIEDGLVYLCGTVIHNTLTDRMIQMHNEGYDIAPLAMFLQNLMENPSYRAVNELYGFLEKSSLPITEDGHFIAYKRVRDNFKDMHSGTMDNSPGRVVKMPRNKVNEDKNKTCSAGLHFCSREYLPHYGARSGTKVVMVKINPKDVVSIPVDYNNAKGRCCKYEVVRELDISENDNQQYMPEEVEGLIIHIETEIAKPTGYVVEKLWQNAVVASYNSPSEASSKTGIDASSIRKVCNGDRKSAGGFGWRWVDDNN